MSFEKLNKELEDKKREYMRARELWIASGRSDKSLQSRVSNLMTDILDIGQAINRLEVRGPHVCQLITKS